MGFKKLYFLVLISFPLFFFSIGNHAKPIASVSSFEDILPAGTRMVIPAEIMQEYQSVSKEWKHPFNYLSHYYSSLGPSTLYKDQHTYYIPLSQEDGKTTGQPGSGTVMVDLMNVQMNKGGTVFKTQKAININNQPVHLSSALFAKKSPFLTQEDTQTEAGASCIDCRVHRVAFSNDSTTVAELREITMPSAEPDFKGMIQNFCNNCGGVKIEDFIQYVESRAKEERIPPDIFFAIMLRESSGKCNAQNITPVEKSFGLFQINTLTEGNNYQGLRRCNEGETNQDQAPRVDPEDPEDLENIKAVCQKEYYRTLQRSACNPEYKKDIDNSKTCLNNPYCGFEEALRTLNCKWLSTHSQRCVNPTEEFQPVCGATYNNDSPRMPDKPWSEMSTIEKDLWRYTIMAYQTESYISKATREIAKMSPEEINQELGNIEASISSFEKMKIYIHKFFCNNNRYPGACLNLAYVEKILGVTNREDSSYINKWNQYKNDNEVKCPPD